VKPQYVAAISADENGAFSCQAVNCNKLVSPVKRIGLKAVCLICFMNCFSWDDDIRKKLKRPFLWIARFNFGTVGCDENGCSCIGCILLIIITLSASFFDKSPISAGVSAKTSAIDRNGPVEIGIVNHNAMIFFIDNKVNLSTS
jgi:hypothetical protein